MDYRLLPLADRAVTFEFGDEISRDINRHVLALHAAIKEALAQGKLDGIIETVATFRSLTVHYDVLRISPTEVEDALKPYLSRGTVRKSTGYSWTIPCCYETDYAPDLVELARNAALSVEEVIAIHSQQVFDVFMLGFLPGFAFLGILDERLRQPRRATPRTQIPKGSVAVAEQMSAVYPSESPAGWHLIGRSPLAFFDLKQPVPALLSAGDKVRFRPITAKEYLEIEKAVQAGAYDCIVACRDKPS